MCWADADIGVVTETILGSKKPLDHPNLKAIYESIVWLKWLMFEQEPSTALDNLANFLMLVSAVCVVLFGGEMTLAFRCRTCEHDPTCAICVPCFHNGNHENHDYSIICIGEGCCDCGDDTAWKREGFYSKHKV